MKNFCLATMFAAFSDMHIWMQIYAKRPIDTTAEGPD